MTEKSESGCAYFALKGFTHFLASLAGFVAGVLLPWCLMYVLDQIADFPRTVKQTDLAFGFAILAVGWTATGRLVLYRGWWSFTAGAWLGCNALALLIIFSK